MSAIRLTVQVELDPQQRDELRQMLVSVVEAAIENIRARRAGDTGGSSYQTPAAPPAAAPFSPPPGDGSPASPAAAAPARPQPSDPSPSVTLCRMCHALKTRSYFNAAGWERGICLACESRDTPGAGEPDEPAWQAIRDAIPEIARAVAAAADGRLHARLEEALRRYDAGLLAEIHREVREVPR